MQNPKKQKINKHMKTLKTFKTQNQPESKKNTKQEVKIQKKKKQQIN